MRQFLDGNGVDTTATVTAFLSTHRALEVVDLYVIKPAPNYEGQYLGKSFLVTNYPSPLLWNYKGVFKPADIDRDGIESKIGLEADTVQIRWMPRDTDILAFANDGVTPVLTALQAFTRGIFDNGTVQIWRCIMPTSGDCNTLGACLLFEGRIGDIEINRALVSLTAISRLETLNEQVPTNIIEPTNVYAEYAVGEGATGFTVQLGSSATKLYTTAYELPEGVDINPPAPSVTASSGGQFPTEQDVWVRLNLESSMGYYTTPATKVTVPAGGKYTINPYAPLIPDLLALPEGMKPLGYRIYVAVTAVGAAEPALEDYWFRPGEWPRFANFIASHSGKNYIFMHWEGDADLYYPWCLPDYYWFFDSNAWHYVYQNAQWVNFPGGSTGWRYDDFERDHVLQRLVDFNRTIPIAFPAVGEWSSTTLGGATYIKARLAAKPPVNEFTGTQEAFFDHGYLIFKTGKLTGTYRAIRQQTQENGKTAFYLYEPLPFSPETNDTFVAYKPTPREFGAATKFAGFPFVPSPINSAVMI